MNQQAFYRDTAIGEWLEDGSYRSWGEKRRTLQVQQYRRERAQSHLLQNVGLSPLESANLQNCRVSGFDWAQGGMTYEERFGRSER